MKSNLVPRIIAGCAFLLYFFFSFLSDLVFALQYGGISSYFSLKSIIYYVVYFIGLTLLAVSLFIDLRILALVGCGICAVRWLPNLVEAIQYYLRANKDPDIYGSVSFFETGIIFFILFILIFALLFFACLFKKASLLLGIGAAVSAFFIIMLVIIRSMIYSFSIVAGNIVEFFALSLLIAGCITMGIAFSREKIKKTPAAHNPNFNYHYPQGWQR